MQHEITQNGPLLNANGTLREPGWARSLLLDYRRADVKAGKAAHQGMGLLHHHERFLWRCAHHCGQFLYGADFRFGAGV